MYASRAGSQINLQHDANANLSFRFLNITLSGSLTRAADNAAEIEDGQRKREVNGSEHLNEEDIPSEETADEGESATSLCHHIMHQSLRFRLRSARTGKWYSPSAILRQQRSFRSRSGSMLRRAE